MNVELDEGHQWLSVIAYTKKRMVMVSTALYDIGVIM